MGDVRIPADGHVHSEWSWDAPDGSMERSCARAIELGLPGICFTEHLDHTVWTVALDLLDEGHLLSSMSTPAGLLTPPPFDAAGYLAEVERCRDLFPELRILTGLELGEPHWHGDATARVLASGGFERVLGSLHCLPDHGAFREPPGLYALREPEDVLREYLAEVAALVEACDSFAVLAHIDYPVRSWPAGAGPFDPEAFEDEFRHALRRTAASGRALEINTVVPLHSTILRWWREEGGEAVTFGSDAHDPSQVAQAFADARDLAEAHGFRPGRDPLDFWPRSS
jgi:histidinol-phosphatase (PHP family)